MWLEEFVQSLAEATAEMPLENILAAKDKYLPKFIYKYRMDSEGSINGLKNNTVWLSSPTAYNDPFDCAASISAERISKALQLNALQQFIDLYGLGEIIAQSDIEAVEGSDNPLVELMSRVPQREGAPGDNPAIMAEFTAVHALPQYARDSASFIQQVQNATKLCSFSEVSDSILMWSHYCKDHTGFCIEYDIGALVTQCVVRKNLYPVVYSQSIYDLTPFMESMINSKARTEVKPYFPLLGVMYKFEGWSYEKEWRLVFFQNTLTDNRTWPVPKPTRVFLGAKMSEARKSEIAAICKEKGIDVFAMKLARDCYELRPEEYVT